METKTSCSASTVILAALGGAAVGAVVALLLAPRSGLETRRQISGHVDTAMGALSRVPEALTQASHAAKEVIGD